MAPVYTQARWCADVYCARLDSAARVPDRRVRRTAEQGTASGAGRHRRRASRGRRRLRARRAEGRRRCPGTRAQEAVGQRDYRLALNHALDSRERAQAAAKRAADERATARSDAERLLADTTAAISVATVRLQGRRRRAHARGRALRRCARRSRPRARPRTMLAMRLPRRITWARGSACRASAAQSPRPSRAFLRHRRPPRRPDRPARRDAAADAAIPATSVYLGVRAFRKLQKTPVGPHFSAAITGPTEVGPYCGSEEAAQNNTGPSTITAATITTNATRSSTMP